MGLDVSHDCWSGAYSAFSRWRSALAKAAGKPDLMTMQGYGGTGDWDEHYGEDVLRELLYHSDCDGELEHRICAALAERLEQLLPEMDAMGDGGGHVGQYGDATRRFIKGLRDAHEAGENVEFH
jgi:hypothetical protein